MELDDSQALKKACKTAWTVDISWTGVGYGWARHCNCDQSCSDRSWAGILFWMVWFSLVRVWSVDFWGARICCLLEKIQDLTHPVEQRVLIPEYLLYGLKFAPGSCGFYAQLAVLASYLLKQRKSCINFVDLGQQRGVLSGQWYYLRVSVGHLSCFSMHKIILRPLCRWHRAGRNCARAPEAIKNTE